MCQMKIALNDVVRQPEQVADVETPGTGVNLEQSDHVEVRRDIPIRHDLD